MKPKDFFSNKEEEGLIKDLNDFIHGKNPKDSRLYIIDKNGKQIEVINELELILE